MFTPSQTSGGVQSEMGGQGAPSEASEREFGFPPDDTISTLPPDDPNQSDSDYILSLERQVRELRLSSVLKDQSLQTSLDSILSIGRLAERREQERAAEAKAMQADTMRETAEREKGAVLESLQITREGAEREKEVLNNELKLSREASEASRIENARLQGELARLHEGAERISAWQGTHVKTLMPLCDSIRQRKIESNRESRYRIEVAADAARKLEIVKIVEEIYAVRGEPLRSTPRITLRGLGLTYAELVAREERVRIAMEKGRAAEVQKIQEELEATVLEELKANQVPLAPR